MNETNDFLLEFIDELTDMTLGRLDLTTGTWTELYKTKGYMESMSSSGIWIVGRSQLKISHRLFIPLYDKDGKKIELDTSVYVVEKKNFDWDTDTDEQLYQVQDSQPYNHHNYVLLESVEI